MPEPRGFKESLRRNTMHIAQWPGHMLPEPFDHLLRQIDTDLLSELKAYFDGRAARVQAEINYRKRHP